MGHPQRFILRAVRRGLAILGVMAVCGASMAQDVPPEVTPEPVAPAVLPVGSPDDLPTIEGIPNAVRLLILARIDLDLLADSQLGEGFRPDGWSGLRDMNSPDLALLLRLDLELLYGTLVSMARPADWIGAVGSTPDAIARDIRHDLEIAADHFFDAGTRPEGWAGGNPLFRCNRATQVLMQLLMLENLYTSPADPASPTYCRDLEISLTRYAETTLLARSELGIFSPPVTVSENTTTIETDYTVAWLDSRARSRVGVVPNGTTVEVLGRSYVRFSNMILVRGEQFTVFIEYTNTGLNSEAFRALPDVNSVPVVPTCYAEWCVPAS